MAPLPDLIRSAGLTRVTIIRNYGTDDEERVEVEAQLLNSKEAYFAIEDPLDEGDHVEMPDHRGGTTVKIAAKVVQHYMPANMRGGFGGSDGMTEVRWGEAEPVRRALCAGWTSSVCTPRSSRQRVRCSPTGSTTPRQPRR